MLVYLDSNILIYLIERATGFYGRAKSHMDMLVANNHEFIASDLNRLECRAYPLANGMHQIVADYDLFFQRRVRQIVGLSTVVCDRATLIRGQYTSKRLIASILPPLSNLVAASS